MIAGGRRYPGMLNSASVRAGLQWRQELPRRRGRYEVTGLTFIAVAPDEDKQALTGCNDVAPLKAWVVHGASVGGFSLRSVGRRGIRRLRTRLRNEFLGAAAGVLHALLPLIAGKLGVGKVLQLLRGTVP